MWRLLKKKKKKKKLVTQMLASQLKQIQEREK